MLGRFCYIVLMNIAQIRRKVIPIFEQHHIVSSSLFGSVARGEDTPRSDIDILVKYRGQKSLLDLVDLQHDLQNVLGRRVDLLTYDGIHPRLRRVILSEQKSLYEKKA